MKHSQARTIWNIAVLMFSIQRLELSILANEIRGVNDLLTLGQLLPLIISVGALVMMGMDVINDNRKKLYGAPLLDENFTHDAGDENIERGAGGSWCVRCVCCGTQANIIYVQWLHQVARAPGPVDRGGMIPNAAHRSLISSTIRFHESCFCRGVGQDLIINVFLMSIVSSFDSVFSFAQAGQANLAFLEPSCNSGGLIVDPTLGPYMSTEYGVCKKKTKKTRQRTYRDANVVAYNPCPLMLSLQSDLGIFPFSRWSLFLSGCWNICFGLVSPDPPASSQELPPPNKSLNPIVFLYL